MTSFDLVNRPQQLTAVIHERVPMKELPQFFERAFGGVMGAIEHQGVAPAGPPFARYFGMPGETVEVEAGFPVAKPIDAEGPVQASELPAARCVHGLHVGPYDTLEQTYGELMQWAGKQGVTPQQSMWEVYLSDPQREPPKTWKTEIFWPVD